MKKISGTYKAAMYIAAVLVGMFLLGPVSWEYIIKPNGPTVILDLDAPIDAPHAGTAALPFEYWPVEVTGKDPSEGVETAVTCKMPEGWLPYIHYPDNWNKWHPMNPHGVVGPVLVYVLYGILGGSIGLLGWAIWKKRKRLARELDKLDRGNRE